MRIKRLPPRRMLIEGKLEPASGRAGVRVAVALGVGVLVGLGVGVSVG